VIETSQRPPAASDLDQLAPMLMDAVVSGAGVSFVLPFSVAAAREWLCFAKIRSARFESRSVVSRSDTLQRPFDRGTVRRRRFPLMRSETAGCQSATQPRRATVVAGVGQAARRS